MVLIVCIFFFFQAGDGIRDKLVTGVQTCALPIDCIVVCEETLLRAEEINAIRFKKGLSKLVIVVVPIMLADDGKPISGERILNKEIDEDGKLVCAK